MKSHVAGIAGALALVLGGAASIAMAEGTPTAASVKVCTNGEVTTCKTATLPKEAGHVRSIIRGNWASPVTASASWAAFTHTHASLCYMGSKTADVVCFPIGALVPKDADVQFRDMGGGIKALVFTQRAGAAAPTEDFYRSVIAFTQALDATSQTVQAHAKNAYHSAVAAGQSKKAGKNPAPCSTTGNTIRGRGSRARKPARKTTAGSLRARSRWWRRTRTIRFCLN